MARSSYLATIAHRTRTEEPVLMPPRMPMRGWGGTWPADFAPEASSPPVGFTERPAASGHRGKAPPIETGPRATADPGEPAVDQPASATEGMATVPNTPMRAPTTNLGVTSASDAAPPQTTSPAASHLAAGVPSSPASPTPQESPASIERRDQARRITIPRPSPTIEPVTNRAMGVPPPKAASIAADERSPTQNDPAFETIQPRTHRRENRKTVGDRDLSGSAPLPAPTATTTANPAPHEAVPAAAPMLRQPTGNLVSPSVTWDAGREPLRPVDRASTQSGAEPYRPKAMESSSEVSLGTAQALHAALNWVSQPSVETPGDQPPFASRDRSSTGLQSAIPRVALDPADPKVGPAPAATAHWPPRSVTPRTIHIGTIEVQIQPPPKEAAALPPPEQVRPIVRPAASASTPGLARGFTTPLGLRQG